MNKNYLVLGLAAVAVVLGMLWVATNQPPEAPGTARTTAPAATIAPKPADRAAPIVRPTPPFNTGPIGVPTSLPQESPAVAAWENQIDQVLRSSASEAATAQI